MTREQMASFIARALDLDPVAGDLFDDVSGVHEGNINALAGWRHRRVRPERRSVLPQDPVRRDQMAFRRPGQEWPEINPPEFHLSLQKLPAASPALAADGAIG